MIRKIVLLGLLTLYLYHLHFSIFLNEYYRIPTPLLYGIPLIVLFREEIVRFSYGKELFWLLVANFLYNYIGLESSKDFFVDSIIITICALFFNYFIGFNKERFKISIAVFCSLLFISTCVMFLNHIFGSPITLLRSQLIGGEITQSPSGITSAIFSFGYQLAALVTFFFTFVFVFKKNILFKGVVVIFCLIAIYFGLQRSVFATFILSSVVFLIAYYKSRSLPIIFSVAVLGIAFSSFFIQESGNYDNIFAKNERKGEENRSNLTIENLKIYTDYPYGLIFYNKTWAEVTRDNPVYRGGLTSHNAYLMFITYLGPFIGVFLLIMIYYKQLIIFKKALFNIRDPDNSLMVCLCFSFLSVSLNSLFHNAWLISANSQAVFLYFAIINLDKQSHHNKRGENYQSE
jgi:hypothetical protein